MTLLRGGNRRDISPYAHTPHPDTGKVSQICFGYGWQGLLEGATHRRASSLTGWAKAWFIARKRIGIERGDDPAHDLWIFPKVPFSSTLSRISSVNSSTIIIIFLWECAVVRYRRSWSVRIDLTFRTPDHDHQRDRGES